VELKKLAAATVIEPAGRTHLLTLKASPIPVEVHGYPEIILHVLLSPPSKSASFTS